MNGVPPDDTEARFESSQEEDTGQSGLDEGGRRIVYGGGGDESLIDTEKDKESVTSAADASGERSDAFGDTDDETDAESDVYGVTDVATARLRSIIVERQGRYSSGKED